MAINASEAEQPSRRPRLVVLKQLPAIGGLETVAQRLPRALEDRVIVRLELDRRCPVAEQAGGHRLLRRDQRLAAAARHDLHAAFGLGKLDMALHAELDHAGGEGAVVETHLRDVAHRRADMPFGGPNSGMMVPRARIAADDEPGEDVIAEQQRQAEDRRRRAAGCRAARLPCTLRCWSARRSCPSSQPAATVRPLLRPASALVVRNTIAPGLLLDDGRVLAAWRPAVRYRTRSA